MREVRGEDVERREQVRENFNAQNQQEKTGTWHKDDS